MPQIVIIGGSYAGLKAVSTIYSMKTANLDVTVVSPSSHVYFNVAAPRLLVEPEKLSQTVFPVEEIVSESSNGDAKFVQGSATNVDFAKREVYVDLAAGGESTLKFDILVIASGTRAKWAGWKVNTSHEDAQKAILATNHALKKASTVAIVGGGPTGVETAGEIAKEFPSAKVTLYTGADAPLAFAGPSLSVKATRKLENLGVQIINDLQIKEVLRKEHGDTLVLDSGETRDYDVGLESFISGPFSSYLPSSVKDGQGFVVTDGNLLVKGCNGVVAFGDIVSGSSKSIVDLKFGQSGIFTATIKKLLQDVQNPGFLTKSTDADSGYNPVKHTLAVPISRDGGVGMLYWVPLPSFLVWLGKARTFMIESARSNFM
ncbi:hypothetical protein OXX79_009213 [Metschnikowia pulcherrima]